MFLINQIINRKGSNTTLSTEIKDLQVDPEIHQPGLGTFKIVVTFIDASEHPFYDETYFRITMNEVELKRNDTDRRTVTTYRDLEPVL